MNKRAPVFTPEELAILEIIGKCGYQEISAWEISQQLGRGFWARLFPIPGLSSLEKKGLVKSRCTQLGRVYWQTGVLL